MNVIYKYALTAPSIDVLVPMGSQPLAVALQDGRAQVWILQPEAVQSETLRFSSLMTGEHFNDLHGDYLGTVVGIEGWIVAHVFWERT